jgi:hypothetical protein
MASPGQSPSQKLWYRVIGCVPHRNTDETLLFCRSEEQSFGHATVLVMGLYFRGGANPICTPRPDSASEHKAQQAQQPNRMAQRGKMAPISIEKAI